jgi:hypothetical protein
MDVSFPFMIKTYYKNGKKACTVDFYVHTQDIEMFHIAVTNGGKVLQLGMVIPEWFGEEERMKATKKGDNTVNENTNEVTAHEDCVQLVRKKYHGQDEVIGEPQRVVLPFQCEEEIEDKNILIFFGDKEVSDGVGLQQYASVLSIDILAAEKKINKKKKGGFLIIGSPDATNATAGAAETAMDDDA